MKSLQKEQKAQIMEYKPQSAGINLQSPQSDSTPWTLTLLITLRSLIKGYTYSEFSENLFKIRNQNKHNGIPDMWVSISLALVGLFLAISNNLGVSLQTLTFLNSCKTLGMLLYIIVFREKKIFPKVRSF